MKRLFIIGNGFDLAHQLPTSFDPHFKEIAQKNEQYTYFWDLYQTRESSIWSDFENLLGRPDFDSLSEIFEGHHPDYTSEKESDRDGSIVMAEYSGNLHKSLEEFANNANEKIGIAERIDEFSNLFCNDSLFINFNYTHTLQLLYGINDSNILHIHGEVGKGKLIIGYTQGNYQPELMHYDVRQKGRGPYVELDCEDYLSNIEDPYVSNAYSILFEKSESFFKKPDLETLEAFLQEEHISDIYVKGHSVNIDYAYFEFLSKRFPCCVWHFQPFDRDTKRNILELIDTYSIINFEVSE